MSDRRKLMLHRIDGCIWEQLGGDETDNFPIGEQIEMQEIWHWRDERCACGKIVVTARERPVGTCYSCGAEVRYSG